MRIAIPVFGNRISPRFDFALEFGLFETVGKIIMDRKDISCEGWGDGERVSRLKNLGVDALICGGLPKHLRDALADSGIRVIPWIAGNAGEALALFLEERLDPGMVICSGRGKGRRCGREIKSQN